MGDPKKIRKKYSRPKKRWDRTRIEEEKKISKDYGLKNKKELWKAETFLRKKRQNARMLLAMPEEKKKQREKELIESLKKIGLVKKNSSLEDVLELKTQELLERRLQTMVLRKGMANTIKQARQFITHGHISVNKNKVSVPSYLVKESEENKIEFLGKAIQLKPAIKKEEKKGIKEVMKYGEKETKEAEIENGAAEEKKEIKVGGEERKGIKKPEEKEKKIHAKEAGKKEEKLKKGKEKSEIEENEKGIGKKIEESGKAGVEKK